MHKQSWTTKNWIIKILRLFQSCLQIHSAVLRALTSACKTITHETSHTFTGEGINTVGAYGIRITGITCTIVNI